MTLSVLKLKALLEQRGISYDNVVEKLELTELVEASGKVTAKLQLHVVLLRPVHYKMCDKADLVFCDGPGKLLCNWTWPCHKWCNS